ncbi:SpoIIE family protein phosphatase [Streptomyces sp. NBRC 110028]|uniref:SpoIIE family protein phosphatase n=1 Tax=Streptomyces sp. NBRC 110028 TaxID=1621260 RepID=UPI000AC988C7|nr:SpoIIE family protein phosphatase [Streptomyces sp. NBRC 110028]
MGVNDRHPAQDYAPAQEHAPVWEAERARLSLLETASEGLDYAELLRLALDHLVAGLQGLGGMAHLRRPDGLGLRLVATCGLSGSLLGPWQTLEWGETAAPMAAFHDGTAVWAADPAGRDSLARSIPPGICMAAVPVPMTAGAPLAVLSVLTSTPRVGDAAQRALARTVTGWLARRLRLLAEGAQDTGRARRQEERRAREERSTPWLQGALRTARIGAWEWDLRGATLTCDDQAQTLLGFEPGTFDGQVNTWLSAIHPEDMPWVQTVSTAESLRGRSEYSVEYRVRKPDGTYRWVQARGTVTSLTDGLPTRVVGTLWDITETRRSRDAFSRALRYMGDGFLVVDEDGRITFGNVEAERFLGASGELRGQVLWELPRARAIGVEPRFRRAAAARAPIDFHARWPSSNRWYHIRLVPVPDGMTVHITDVTDRRALDAERSAAAHAAAERATRIAELTSAFAEALTTRDVVKAVADRVLPPFGATGLICQLIEDKRLRVVGSTGYSDTFLGFLDNIPVPAAPLRSPVAEVLGSRSPLFISSPEDYAKRFPDVGGYLSLSGKKAWAFLPLVASDHRAGYCVVSFDRPRHFSEEERTLLIAISGLVAQALERARLYDAEHTRAQELQRGLLPRTLPALPAVTAAARYLPAGEGMEVGGDWYDLIPLSGERVALVIGDVMGHGLSEAATMGRLRTAVHTLADLELPPDELLTHLNDLVGALGDDFYATCLYAIYDPTTSVCAFACAGHPPPAIIHPDGTVHSPGFSPDPPLGAATPPFETIEVQLPEDSILVLCTDGLIESATRDIDRGMAYLSRTLADALATTPDLLPRPSATGGGSLVDGGGDRVLGHLDRLCDTLVAALLPEQSRTQDDAALLVARTHSMTADSIASWRLPDAPIAAGEARHHVRDQLGAWQLDELAVTTELLVSELVGNVVRHAKGPVRLRLLRSRSLICEVSDASPTMPRIRRASYTDEGGRGLQLVSALSHRWGTRFTPTGKCIWAEQSLPAG